MKTSARRYAGYLAAIALMVFQTATAVAQEATRKLDVDIDVNKGGGDAGNFFAQPWVWIVGGAVFILLLVALMRGRGGRGDA